MTSRKPHALRTPIIADGPAKAGPGQIFVVEPIAHGSGHGQSQRARNIGEHPLTLAREKGKITAREFEAGEYFRTQYEKTLRSGVDSTQRQPSGGQNYLPWTTDQARASAKLGELKIKLGDANYRIAELFCGHGMAMSEAVARVVPCHPNGVLYRLREALARLADVLGA